MSLIVDASVAVKLYLPEAGSEAAEQVFSASADLLAPELVLAEIGNAVWKRVRTNEVAVEDAVRIMDRARAAFDTLVPLAELAVHAMRISAVFRHPIYDCFYLALAVQRGAPVLTADERLASLAARMGVEAQTLAAG